MEIEWSELALSDLDAIAHYVAEKFGDTVSQRSINKIVSKVEGLRRFPESGVLDKPYSSPEFSVRHFTLAPSVIYYLLEKDSIVVMTVVHVKRSPSYINKVLRNFLEHHEM